MYCYGITSNIYFYGKNSECRIISFVSYHEYKKEKKCICMCIKSLCIHNKMEIPFSSRVGLEVRGVRETYFIVYPFVSLEFYTMYMIVLLIKNLSPNLDSQIKVSFRFSSIWKFGIVLQAHLVRAYHCLLPFA